MLLVLSVLAVPSVTLATDSASVVLTVVPLSEMLELPMTALAPLVYFGKVLVVPVPVAIWPAAMFDPVTVPVAAIFPLTLKFPETELPLSGAKLPRVTGA